MRRHDERDEPERLDTVQLREDIEGIGVKLQQAREALHLGISVLEGPNPPDDVRDIKGLISCVAEYLNGLVEQCEKLDLELAQGYELKRNPSLQSLPPAT